MGNIIILVFLKFVWIIGLAEYNKIIGWFVDQLGEEGVILIFALMKTVSIKNKITIKRISSGEVHTILLKTHRGPQYATAQKSMKIMAF